jgi:hypothetical protein
MPAQTPASHRPDRARAIAGASLWGSNINMSRILWEIAARDQSE